MVVCVIPARYAASRLPGKPLLDLGGKPMIQWVWEVARRARGVERVVVATDHDRVCQAVEDFGGEVRLTGSHHTSGTSRVAEVAWDLEAEVFINLQGDEPLMPPENLEAVVALLRNEPGAVVATACVPFENGRQIFDPHVVKVAVSRNGRALYFSRLPVPFLRKRGWTYENFPRRLSSQQSPHRKHLGLYAYRRSFLLEYPSLAPSALEEAEQLEQLRFLEHGYWIQVAEVRRDSVGVDTPEDAERVRRLLRRGGGRPRKRAPAVLY